MLAGRTSCWRSCAGRGAAPRDALHRRLRPLAAVRGAAPARRLAAMRRRPRRDLLAGLTVAIVALPLALGFGISSGLGAQAGLVTAVVAGALAAVFGGSNLQVSGPTGAMTVVLVPIVHQHGAAGVLTVGAARRADAGRAGAGRGRPVHARMCPPGGGGLHRRHRRGHRPAAGPRPRWASPTPHGDKVTAVAWHGRRRLRRATRTGRPRRVAAGGGRGDAARRAAGGPPCRSPCSPSPPRPSLAQSRTWTWPGSARCPPALPAPSLASWTRPRSARCCPPRWRSPPWPRWSRCCRPPSPTAMSVGSGTTPTGSCSARAWPTSPPAVRRRPGDRARSPAPRSTSAPAPHSRLAALTHAAVLAAIVFAAAPLVAAIPLAALAGVLLATAIRMVEVGSLLALARSTRGDALVMALTAVATLALDLVTAVILGLSSPASSRCGRRPQRPAGTGARSTVGDHPPRNTPCSPSTSSPTASTGRCSSPPPTASCWSCRGRRRARGDPAHVAGLHHRRHRRAGPGRRDQRCSAAASVLLSGIPPGHDQALDRPRCRRAAAPRRPGVSRRPRAIA